MELSKRDQPGPGEKLCPFCAETIRAAAIRCRYCHSDLDSAEPAPPRPATPLSALPSPAPAATSAADPDDDGAATEASSGTPQSARSSASGGFLHSVRLMAILVVLCLVLAVAVALSWWRAEHPEGGAAPDGAITSSQARDAGMQAAATLTREVLSYDWKTLDKDIATAQKQLAPTFRAEYLKTMNGVKRQTVANQVTLTAVPVATSIVSASEDKVQALVFVNQVTTAKGSKNQRLDQNRVLVTLTRDAGEWRVSKMKAF